MRVSLLLVALISSGCTTTSVTQRTALGVIPATPATLAGTSGMALTSRFMPSAPIPEKSTATATPYFQPELSGVVRVGKHFAVSGRTSFVSGSFPLQPAGLGPGIPEDALSLESTLGLGFELPLGDRFGLMAALEAGLVFPSVNVRDTTFNTRTVETNVRGTLRGALGAFVTFGPLRLYVAGEMGDIITNDATSLRTRCFGCFDTETGTVGAQGILLVGGGARVMLGKYVSVAAEGWTGAQFDARTLPFIGAATLRVGSFDIPLFDRPPPPVFEPPPVPEWEDPAQAPAPL
ncbi:MAG: hypothetical protein QM817_34875 [Archangium sp.]